MLILFQGDADGVQVRISVEWRSLRAVLKALLPLIATLIFFLTAPEVIRLASYLGWR